MCSNFDANEFQRLMLIARKEVNETLKRRNIKAKYELYAPAIQDNPEITVIILRATESSLGSGMLYNVVNAALLDNLMTSFHLEADTVAEDYKFTQDDSIAF